MLQWPGRTGHNPRRRSGTALAEHAVGKEFPMLSNKVAVALLGLLALVGAAGAGAFFASRPSVQPVIAEDVKAPATSEAASKAVEATEAVVDDRAAEQDAPPVAEPPAPAPSQPAASKPAAPSRPAQRARRDAAPVASRTSPLPREPRSASAPATPATKAQESRAADPTDPIPQNVPSPASANHTAADDTLARSERVAPVEPLPPAPPQPQFQEVTVPAVSVIGLRIETSLSSETARVEERVEARVSRDVRADGRVAIPAGSRVIGSVSLVDRGGRMKEQARLGVRFHTVILADGTELPLQTETIYRVGESPGSASAAKVGGGAIGGAILGAILGGGKGAAIGSAVGAAGGTAAVMAGGRRAAQISAGSPVTVKVLSPVTVNVEKE
jgi:type IV secretory pathway VirB10-like protein